MTGLLVTFAGFVVLAIVAGIYLANNIRVSGSGRGGKDVSLQTPAGQISIRAHEDLDPATVGIPLYPGATRRKEGGAAAFEWTSNDGKSDRNLSFSGAELFTPDSASKVIEYYRGRFPDISVIDDHDGSTRLEYREAGYKRIVVIRQRADGTHIGVASVGQPVAN